MKNFKKMTALFCMIIVACMSFGAIGCGKDTDLEQIDPNRTQLYVFNYAGGYGVEWLNAIKKDYEELHKNDIYEPGTNKKGIQIYIKNEKSICSAMKDTILDNREEVYFTEKAYYYDLLADGIVGDITEAVKADLSAYGDEAGSTIENKLTEEQKNYFGVKGDDGSVKYYGLPHYASYEGLIYNADLFDEKGYYFVEGHPSVEENAPLEDYFVYDSSDKKSAGPDGKTGVIDGVDYSADDGLPATYEEFFLLCDYIARDLNTPVCWNGKYYKDYQNELTHVLVANYEGLDQMMLNFTVDGVAADLGKIVDGEFLADSSPLTITAANGYELSRQAGKYYALEFMEKLTTTSKYHNDLAFNNAYTHLDAQNDFLYAGNDGVTSPIAMLSDGIWWENEASETFKIMTESKGQQYAKENRNFKFMPLPKANEDKVGEKNVLLDTLFSMCFMKSNIEEWKKPIAYDFIKYVNSNAALVQFTQITNTPKALIYEMREEEQTSMTTFGKSVLAMKQNSDIVYPYSSSRIYINNQSNFMTHSLYYSEMDGLVYGKVAEAFNDYKKTASEYFNGMYAYYSENWSSYNY